MSVAPLISVRQATSGRGGQSRSQSHQHVAEIRGVIAGAVGLDRGGQPAGVCVETVWPNSTADFQKVPRHPLQRASCMHIAAPEPDTHIRWVDRRTVVSGNLTHTSVASPLVAHSWFFPPPFTLFPHPVGPAVHARLQAHNAAKSMRVDTIQHTHVMARYTHPTYIDGKATYT